MRIIVVFIILILIGSGLYTAYGVLTFEPEKPKPLVFQEPTPESLQALGIYPADTRDQVALSPEQQDRTQKAVEKISEAITVYQQYEEVSPLRLKDTISTLKGAMGSGILPAYFLSTTDAAHPARQFEMLTFEPTLSMESTGQGPLNCADQVSVLMGADLNDTISCKAPATTGDQIFIGGPGADTISDSFGNRIVNAGGGDDTITLGPGRSIIVLDESWGKDTLTADCKGAAIADAEVPKDFPVPWVSKFTNFIVLNPRIPQNSVRWQGNVLTNTETGDTLSVNENCFTLVGQ